MVEKVLVLGTNIELLYTSQKRHFDVTKYATFWRNIDRIGRYNEVIMESIKLNDLLQLTEEQIANTKIRFMTPSERIGFNPNRDAEDLVKQDEINLHASVYNREKSVSFKEGVIAIGFIRIDIDKDLWLMTGVEH